MYQTINTVFKTANNRNVIFFLFAVFIFLFSKDFGFYHDDITFGSKVGNHLYNTSIFNWIIPENFDSGHPPTFGFLLAVIWKLFGKSLFVSHLLMLPFIFGFLVQLYKFIGNFVTPIYLKILALILVLADPTVSSTLVLVNMEIISLFLFFLTINSILNQQKYYKYIGLFFLSFLSLRYMMLFCGIFLFEFLKIHLIDKKSIRSILLSKFILEYILCFIPAIIYILWRYNTYGYLTNPNSPWASYGNFVDVKYFIRNCIVLVWRYLDFGRVFIMFFLLINIWTLKRKFFESKRYKELLLLSISSVFFIALSISLVTNTMSIRYFIVSYICFNILAFILVNNHFRKKKLIYAILLIGLFSGNFWVYPKSISQSWHNTLGLIPYHSLREEAIQFLNTENIEIESLGSFFPNYTKLDYIDLQGDERSFNKFSGNESLVFYSNVYNLTDKEQQLLNKKYDTLKEFNNFNINIIIYRLKEK